MSILSARRVHSTAGTETGVGHDLSRQDSCRQCACAGQSPAARRWRVDAMSTAGVDEQLAGLAGDGEHELESRELDVAGFEGPLAGRLYRAVVDGRRDLLIVCFHGGGFVDGDLDEADGFLRRLAIASGYPVVLSSTYTLAPVKPFPAAVEDAHAVLAWASRNKARLGWTGKRMLVAGIEAGGNLAAVAAMMARDRGAPPVAGQILVMPML